MGLLRMRVDGVIYTKSIIITSPKIVSQTVDHKF